MELSKICEFVKEKVDTIELNVNNYISTENMITNRGGVVEAASLPNVNQTQAYKLGDVLVSNIRPYFRKIWQADRDGGCSNDVLVFRAKQYIDSIYLYYVLSDDNFFNYAMLTSKGTKMPRGDKKAIMKYEVPEYDEKTQKRISRLLRCIDERIQINNTINNNLVA